MTKTDKEQKDDKEKKKGCDKSMQKKGGRYDRKNNRKKGCENTEEKKKHVGKAVNREDKRSRR
jgi:hypothetical protein